MGIHQAFLKDIQPRFSGHESFVCRYGWLPKICDFVKREPELYSRDEEVMAALGIGRNMVKSIRFWATAFGVLESESKQPTLTNFGRWLLSDSDPFLESVDSLWLLHWRLTTKGNLGAWRIAFYDSPEPEILRKFFTNRVSELANQAGKSVSPTTINQHVGIFLDTYAPSHTSANAAPEESLGCPLQELGLVKVTESSDAEHLIELPRGRSPFLSTRAFLLVLLDFWRTMKPHERSISFRSLLLDAGSPGQVLRLTEAALLSLLREAESESQGTIDVSESVERQLVELRAVDIDFAMKSVGYAYAN